MNYLSRMMAKMKEEMRTDMVKDLERREAELREEMAGQLEKMETHIGRMCRLESFKCGMKYAHRWRRVMLSFQDTIDASEMWPLFIETKKPVSVKEVTLSSF